MLPTSLLRATMTAAALPLLLFFGLCLGHVPIIATGTSFPDYDPWDLSFYYFDTVGGKSRLSDDFSDYYPTDCEARSFRADYLKVTLKTRFRFLGWNNPDCKGDPIFDIKGLNLTFFEPPKRFEAYQVIWLGNS